MIDLLILLYSVAMDHQRFLILWNNMFLDNSRAGYEGEDLKSGNQCQDPGGKPGEKIHAWCWEMNSRTCMHSGGVIESLRVRIRPQGWMRTGAGGAYTVGPVESEEHILASQHV